MKEKHATALIQAYNNNFQALAEILDIRNNELILNGIFPVKKPTSKLSVIEETNH